MSWIIGGVVVVGAVSAVVVWFLVSNSTDVPTHPAFFQEADAWRHALDQVAETYGLSVVPAPQLTAYPSCRGTVGRHTIVVDTYGGPTTQTRVRCSGGVAPDLELMSRVKRQLPDAFGGFESKDPAFDVDVVVTGEPYDRALSRLDAACRTVIAKAITSGATLEAGRWTLTMSGVVTHADRLVNAIGEVLAAAEALERTDGPCADGLQHLVVHDPDPKVRLHAARSVAGPHAADAYTALLDDPDPALRRHAAVALARMGSADPVRLEGVLLAHLDYPNAELIEALGTIGTEASLPALQAMTESRLNFGATARRGDDAIRRIVARTSEAAPPRVKRPRK